MIMKMQKLLTDFNNITNNNNEQHPNITRFLKNKALKLQKTQEDIQQLDWKQELIESYSILKKTDTVKQKIVNMSEQIISQYKKCLKQKDLQIQMLTNEINIMKSSFQEQKYESQKVKKQHDKLYKQLQKKFNKALEKIDQKQYELRQLENKINEYEQQLEEIKSLQYQKMLDSIKQQQIMNTETQNLFKQNSLLKFQLREQLALKNQLSRHIKTLNDEIQDYHVKYQKLKQHLERRKSQNSNRTYQKDNYPSTARQITSKPQQQTINLIQYKDDFSFKDSMENDNNSTIVHNNLPSFLQFQSGNDFYGNHSQGNQQSPQRCLKERDILNLTQRDRSTQSKNITKHLIRSKKQYLMDKENISDNTLELNEFEHNQSTYRHSNINQRSRKHINQVNQQFTSKCSIQSKHIPSYKMFGTQQRFLNKHRRIKSSFCGKSIQQFQQYQNNKDGLVNSEKLQESICEQTNNLENQSTIIDCDVNEIVINEELISSKKPRMNFQANMINSSGNFQSLGMMNNNFNANMIKSVQVIEPSPSTNTPVDIYYAFFSLTAQCVKLNSKNFNKIIQIYFNLQQEYKNVLNKTIPINKWYNYIEDQIQMALKYTS